MFFASRNPAPTTTSSSSDRAPVAAWRPSARRRRPQGAGSRSRAEVRPGPRDADVPAPQGCPLRGGGGREKPFGFYDATVDGGWHVPGEPYTTAPGSDFLWWRARMLGGRTNHWGRISLRMGPYDFKPQSRDGLGVDWPIGYEDLAPYYDKTELLVGVYGSERRTGEHAGFVHRACCCRRPRRAPHELLTARHCKPLGIPGDPGASGRAHVRQDGAALARKLHPAIRWPSGCWQTSDAESRLRASGRRRAGAAARSRRTSNRRPCCCRRRSRRGNCRHRHRRDGARGDGRQERPRDRRELHRQEDPHRPPRERAWSSCSRRAAARPRASCSTRRARCSRTAWRTAAGKSGHT